LHKVINSSDNEKVTIDERNLGVLEIAKLFTLKLPDTRLIAAHVNEGDSGVFNHNRLHRFAITARLCGALIRIEQQIA